jgi:hypothetical protein
MVLQDDRAKDAKADTAKIRNWIRVFMGFGVLGYVQQRIGQALLGGCGKSLWEAFADRPQNIDCQGAWTGKG